VPLYVAIFRLLAQGIDLGRRFLGVGFAKTALTCGMGGHDSLDRLGLADGKQADLLQVAVCPRSSLGNTFLYLKQVLGNLVHISLVIL
jgi:hypothetical protein